MVTPLKNDMYYFVDNPCICGTELQYNMQVCDLQKMRSYQAREEAIYMSEENV